MIQECDYCEQRVIARENGSCPSCQAPLPEFIARDNVDSDAGDSDAGEDTGKSKLPRHRAESIAREMAARSATKGMIINRLVKEGATRKVATEVSGSALQGAASKQLGYNLMRMIVGAVIFLGAGVITFTTMNSANGALICWGGMAVGAVIFIKALVSSVAGADAND